MEIIPAIDLSDGRCVRLLQGRYDRRIEYCDDPVAQARRFGSQGARWLHVVDLDGAKAGRPINTGPIARLAALGTLKLEVGGGLRDADSIRRMLDLGVERVVVGTKAVRDFDWFEQITGMFEGRVALGMDARSGLLATDGWTKDSKVGAMDLAVRAAGCPVAAIIYTDIARDGMLTGPDVDTTKAIASAVGVPVIASGGVATTDHIQALVQAKCIAGAILGRSLYEGTIDLAEAIRIGAGGP